MNTEFVSSWKRTLGIRHYLAEFDNSVLFTASLRYCRKIVFTVFYVGNQILNHAMIFKNIKVFFS